MRHLNGHDLKEGDMIKVAGGDKTITTNITHCGAQYIHVGKLLFFKTSGRGANMAATGLKLERVNADSQNQV